MRAYVPEFDMRNAADLGEALELMAVGYQPFAGGTDLMVLFNVGKLKPRPFVNVRKLADLQGIVVRPDFIEIGAAVTYCELRNHATLHNEFPLLVQSAGWTGSIANQNRGTLGGNIANASPAADSSPVLLAYDAELKLVSKKGERWVTYSNFHRGYKLMDLQPGELIASIRLPRGHTDSHYGRKVGTRKAMAISKVSIAATKSSQRFRIGVGSVAPMAIRCIKTEQFLMSEKVTTSMIEEARRIIGQEISPVTDIRSTRDYRLAVTQNLLGEFLETLV